MPNRIKTKIQALANLRFVCDDHAVSTVVPVPAPAPGLWYMDSNAETKAKPPKDTTRTLKKIIRSLRQQ